MALCFYRAELVNTVSFIWISLVSLIVIYLYTSVDEKFRDLAHKRYQCLQTLLIAVPLCEYFIWGCYCVLFIYELLERI